VSTYFSTRQDRMKLLIILTILTIGSCGHRLSPEEEKQYQDNMNKVQNGVSNWIKKQALYPDSYESVSFVEYSESFSKRHDEKIPNTENYVIKHTHKILDKDSILTIFSGYFILEHDYSVNIIETERSNSIGGAFPPQIQVWTDKFGRPENHQDSLEFEQKQKQVTNKFINELKDGLEKGDIYTEDPKDINKLKNIIDTLERKK
jgi:hypothetical protein